MLEFDIQQFRFYIWQWLSERMRFKLLRFCWFSVFLYCLTRISSSPCDYIRVEFESSRITYKLNFSIPFSKQFPLILFFDAHSPLLFLFSPVLEEFTISKHTVHFRMGDHPDYGSNVETRYQEPRTRRRSCSTGS